MRMRCERVLPLMLMLALSVVLLSSGCDAVSPVVELVQPAVALPESSVRRVGEIPNAVICSAVASQVLVYESYEQGTRGGIYLRRPWTSARPVKLGGSVLTSGTGSPYSELGPANPSATRSGVFFDSGGDLYFQRYGSSQPTATPFNGVDLCWASPGGKRLLLSEGAAYSFVGPAQGAARQSWIPPNGSIGDAVWLDDDHLIVQVDDSPPDGGWGSVYALRFDESGSVQQGKASLVKMSCPAPNPSTGLWAHYEDGKLAFSRPGSARFMTWWPTHPGEDSWVAGTPCWLDATYLAVPVTNSRSNSDSIWILDCVGIVNR